MSYAVAPALQAAIYQHLQSDSLVDGLVGDAIFDAAPTGLAPDTYVVLGTEDARDRSSKTHIAAAHDFTISVVTDAASFHTAKTVASAICDALVDADLTLSRGRLIGLSFQRARAAWASGGEQRKIDLRFRALVEDQ